MTKSIKPLLSVLVVIAMVSMSFTIFGASGSNAATPAASTTSTPTGEFIYGTPISTSVADLNPLTAANSLSSILVGQMYADSLGFVWTSGAITPWLAKSWTITTNSNGSETIVFHLNPNASWVNGSSVVSQITAKDVAFTFDLLMANSSLDSYGLGPHIMSLTTSGNTTVTFLIDHASSLWFDIIASQTIIPSAWAAYDHGNISKVGGYTNMGPIGQELTAGPFVLSNLTSQGAIMKANTNFWMGSPKVAKVYIEKFSTTASATLALEKAQIGVENPALSDYYGLQNQPNITSVRQVEPWVFYLWMNDLLAPYNNVHVRQGLAYAINKSQIMVKAEDTIGSWGATNTSDGGLPTVLKADWAPNLHYYAYNVSKAELQMEKAGYHIATNGSYNGYFVNNTTNQELTFTINEPSNIADWVSAGDFITGDLNAAHIHAVFDVVPIGTWATTVFNESNFNVLTYFGYVPSFTNPYLQLQQLFASNGGWNFEGFNNATVNTAFNNSADMSNLTQLVQSLYPVQKIIDQQIPIIPIGDAGNFYAYNTKEVQGFIPNLTSDNPLNWMTVTVPGASSTTTTTTPTSSGNYTLYYIIGAVVVIAVIGSLVGLTVSKRGKKGEK